MIISKTPYTLSFCGGGTDLPSYYENFGFGAVTSTTIDKYMYITVGKRFDESIRVSYSKTEIVNTFEEIEHRIIREAMRLTGVNKSLEIHSIGDIPSGTGMGSSSTFTVGLLNALYAYNGVFCPPERLAKEACQIEIDILKEPIGKQDQYAAAFGGLRHIRFNNDGSVNPDIVPTTKEVTLQVHRNLILFYLNKTRSASEILSVQNKQSVNKEPILTKMRDLAEDMRDCISDGRLESFGTLLHMNWELKKQLAGGISDPFIDNVYNLGMMSGAEGGKVLGAGGGGFILFYAPKEKHDNIRCALKDLREFKFAFESDGSRIIYAN